MSKPRVIISRRWPEAVEQYLAERYDVVINESDTPMSADEMRAALTDCDAFCPTVSDRVDAEVLGVEGLRARVIGNFGVGSTTSTSKPPAHGAWSSLTRPRC